MRLRNMLKICLVFCKSEPRYAYKHYAYKKTCRCPIVLCNHAKNEKNRPYFRKKRRVS